MYCAAIWVRGSLKEELSMLCKLAKTIVFVVLVQCIVSTMAVAAEMMCTKADEKGCTMAKGADGKEMAVMGAGMKMGDKMDCMSKDGKLKCMKDGMMKK
jgi:hypothetical protein